MLENLLASSGWILDLVFFLILVLGTALGAYRGFVTGICKLAGKIVSIIFAFMFCVSFANFLEVCFHMTSAITNGIAASIAKNEVYAIGLPTDVVGAEITMALRGLGVGAFPSWLIGRAFARVELIPAGTTAATLIASVLAKWISIVIAFVLLIVLVRLAVLLISKLFGAIKDSFAPLRVVDQVLGALLGFVESCLLVFLILLLINWLPLASLHAFIGSSNIVGKIFTAEWFQSATSYAISGKWFGKYVKTLIG